MLNVYHKINAVLDVLFTVRMILGVVGGNMLYWKIQLPVQ